MKKLARVMVVLVLGGCVVVAGQQPGPVGAAVAVPNVMGMPLSEASTRIRARGLRLGQVRYAPGVAGMVIAQKPGPGGRLTAGQAVYLTVGSAEPAAPVAAVVPQVTGLRLKDARRAIEAEGLRVGRVAFVFSPAAADKTVISQSPRGGAAVKRGSQVELKVSMREQSVAVPNVIGVTLAEASAMIVAAGLIPGGIESVNVPGVPPGKIASQRPSAGSQTRPGSAVTLKVSTGLAMSVVPNVVGLGLPEATQTLAAAGLSVAAVASRPSSLPEGTIVSQEPEVGTLLRRNSGVSLVLSAVQKQVAVPPVVGLDLARAGEILRASSLEPGQVHRIPGRGRRGTVVAQSPEAGTLTAEGSRVALTVSSGRGQPFVPVPTVAVPNVVGMKRWHAETALQRAGLEVGAVKRTTGIHNSIVKSQSPAAGSMAPSGSKVNLTVTQKAFPSRMVQVPDLVGARRQQVEQMLQKVWLVPGKFTEVPGPRPGVVVSQWPLAGERVMTGTNVDVNVAVRRAPPKEAIVPNVVGAQRGQAEAAIRKAGLQVGNVSEVAGDRQNVVVSQDPAAGTRVQAGTAVKLAVSRKQAPPAAVTVPNVVGVQRRAAEARLKRSGLVAGTVSTRPGGRKDVVASQDPRARARVPAGSQVSLVVWAGAAGRVQARVPQLVGMERTAALRALRGVGLAGQTRRAEGERNVVLSQSPAAGTAVAAGSTVILTVGTGRARGEVTVPGVVAMNRRAAEARLRAAGLVVGEVSTRAGGRKDVVASQDPAAGSRVARGARVSLVLWTGQAAAPGRTTVPQVVGMTVAQAQVAVKAQGLVVGRVQRRPGGQPNVVMQQTPAAGTEARTGSRVDLVVGAEATGVRVPQLVGMNLSQAQARLRQANLAVGEVTRAPGGRKDRVVSHSPRAGTLVAPGSKVALTVYAGAAGARVPSVIGRRQADAQKILRDAGYKAKVEHVNWGRKGVVANQNPRAGMSAAAGTTVVIYIGK